MKTKASSALLSHLDLDLENPRLFEAEPRRSENEVLGQLVHHWKVIALVQSISKDGFYPWEAPVVMRNQRQRYTVLEGNRRVAACKLLVDPSLAGGGTIEKKVRGFAQRADIKSLKRLPIWIVAGRQAVAQALAQRHTTAGMLAWDPLSKARYAASLLQDGMELAEAAVLVSMPEEQLTRLLRRHHAHRLAGRVPASDSARAIVQNQKKFPISTLERAYNNPSVRAALGFDFDRSGELTITVPPQDFRKSFTRLIEEVANRIIDSRKQNTSEKMAAHIRAWPKELMPAKRGLSPVSAYKAFPEGGIPAAALSSPRARKKARSSLIPSDFPCNTKHERPKRVLRELRRTNPAEGGMPNAFGLLSRVFFEHALYSFLEAKGEIQKIRPRQQNTPSAEAMLEHLRNNPALLNNRPLQRALPALKREAIDTLNLLVHNITYDATEARVVRVWKDFEPLIRKLLE